MALISASKLRAVADRLERDALAQVAELRRLADLMDGVKKIARTKAKAVKKTKRVKVTRVRRKVAKKVRAKKRAVKKAKGRSR